MTDRERISFGRIVFHDHAEILQHEKCGSACAPGQEQIGARVGLAKRTAAGTAHAHTLPLPERHLPRPIGQEIIETGWQNDLVTPRLPGNPAVHF